MDALDYLHILGNLGSNFVTLLKHPGELMKILLKTDEKIETWII